MVQDTQTLLASSTGACLHPKIEGLVSDTPVSLEAEVSTFAVYLECCFSVKILDNSKAFFPSFATGPISNPIVKIIHFVLDCRLYGWWGFVVIVFN